MKYNFGYEMQKLRWSVEDMDDRGITQWLYLMQLRGKNEDQRLTYNDQSIWIRYKSDTQTFNISDFPWYYVKKRDGEWKEVSVKGNISGNRVIIVEVRAALAAFNAAIEAKQ